MNNVRKVQVEAIFRAVIGCSLIGGRAGRTCVWMAAQWHVLRASQAGAGKVLALTNCEQSVGFTRACKFRPCCTASRQALEEPVGPADRPGPSPPIHPADHLRGINLVARHIDVFEKESQAAAAL